MSLFYQCIIKQIFAPVPPLPVAVCHPFPCNAPAHHIMVNTWHAVFVLFCDGGCLGCQDAIHQEIDRWVGPKSYVATNHHINSTIK